MMLSLCTTYWQVLLAQAFCIGIGVGCLFIPSVAILSTYFSHRLALATGIAASGSSLGGVLYPIVLNKLYPSIGFGWTVRVIGFMTLGTLLVPNLVMKVRVLPPARRKMVDTSAFTHWAYVAFCGGSFLVFLGLFQPFFFVQEFAIVKQITNDHLAFYLIPILNAASVFGRIFPNFLADKTGPMNVIVPCTLASGALILALIGVKTKAVIIVVLLIFGFMSGSLVSLPPTVIVHLTKDRRFIGTRLGMYFCFVAIGALVGSPVGGAILNSSGFNALWIFGGVLCCVGGLVMGWSRVIHKGSSLTVKA
jgi:MFS family permease